MNDFIQDQSGFRISGCGTRLIALSQQERMDQRILRVIFSRQELIDLEADVIVE